MFSEHLEKLCERWTGFICSHPWKTVVVVTLLNALFGLGLLSMNKNNDFRDLYVARETDSEMMKSDLLGFYPDQSGKRFQVHATVEEPLVADIILAVDYDNLANYTESLKTVVENIRLSTDFTQNLTFNDVCARYDGKCVVREVDSEDRNHSNDTRFRKLRFYLRQDMPGWRTFSVQWMDKFIQSMNGYSSNIGQVVYSDSLSFYDRLNSDTYRPDITYFGLAFTVLIVYSSFMVLGGDCLSKRTNLGRMGIIVTPLSILGSWGFCGSTGLEFTNINGVMAFAALCKCVFVLCHSLYD